jgi:biopolymer transport protein ExbB
VHYARCRSILPKRAFTLFVLRVLPVRAVAAQERNGNPRKAGVVRCCETTRINRSARHHAGLLVNDIDPLDLLAKGGVLVWPILLCSLVGMTIFFERLLLYRRIRKQHQDLDQIYQLVFGGRFDDVRFMIQSGSAKATVAKRIILEALNVEQPDRETVEMVVVHAVQREMSALTQNLGTLALLASTAPLLGLLGTVFGMIKAFFVVQSMGGHVNASVLAGGIWEAMLTTALGLCVAIPLVFCHNHLESRLQVIQAELEEVAIMFMKAWSKGHSLAP